MTFSYALQTTLKKALKAFETEGGLLKSVCKSTAK